MFNVSDLMDQAVIKQTAEKNALLTSLQSFPNYLWFVHEPDVVSFLSSLVNNPNISIESFRWLISEVL